MSRFRFYDNANDVTWNKFPKNKESGPTKKHECGKTGVVRRLVAGKRKERKLLSLTFSLNKLKFKMPHLNIQLFSPSSKEKAGCLKLTWLVTNSEAWSCMSLAANLKNTLGFFS